MTITITPQTIITAAGVLAAVIAITAFIARGVRWVDRQEAQDKDIKDIGDHHDEDIRKLQEEYDKKFDTLRAEVAKQLSNINSELSVICEGMLACLCGLQEQGCNGPVTAGLDKLNTHLNNKAHKEDF